MKVRIDMELKDTPSDGTSWEHTLVAVCDALAEQVDIPHCRIDAQLLVEVPTYQVKATY